MGKAVIITLSEEEANKLCDYIVDTRSDDGKLEAFSNAFYEKLNAVLD